MCAFSPFLVLFALPIAICDDLGIPRSRGIAWTVGIVVVYFLLHYLYLTVEENREKQRIAKVVAVKNNEQITIDESVHGLLTRPATHSVARDNIPCVSQSFGRKFVATVRMRCRNCRQYVGTDAVCPLCGYRIKP